MSGTTIKGPARRQKATSKVPCLRLVFGAGASDGGWRVLAVGTTRLGRSADADLRLDDDRVSRKHAELTCDAAGKVRVVDASANGVFVNGRRVGDGSLDDGDILRLGDSLLVLRYRDPAEAVEPPLPGCIGDAPAACAMYRVVRKVARASATVLVMGESGTGKELVASAIHVLGHPETPFIAVNCAAIAETLAESTLFGHVAGAFTGASKAHQGYFRAADGGVLFLDEVGELALPLQAKLLRALEQHEVTPVGADAPIPCRPRVIAATNKDLTAAVFAGAFRGDLYARLAEVLVTTPALRERREDILPIFYAALGAGAPPLSADLCEAMLVHAWPFNVRELCKVAVDLRVRGEGLAMLDVDLVADRWKQVAQEPPTAAPEAAVDRDAPPDRDALVQLLHKHAGSIADVARETGRSRKQVYRWLELHGLDPKTFRSG